MVDAVSQPHFVSHNDSRQVMVLGIEKLGQSYCHAITIAAITRPRTLRFKI